MSDTPTTYQKCAAQHFGPWMVEPTWFAQAVSAVKAGTFKAETVRDTATGEKLYETTAQGIATISIAGQITKGDSSYGGASSVRVRNAIRKAVNDDRVSAIVLQIDSPGGTVSGTGDLASDVAAADKRKPVYTYFEDLGCSAAYWIGCQAREVFANPTAMIGSIGTVAVVEDTSGAYDKAGIKVHVISTGPYKGAFVDGAPVTDDQLKDLQREVDDLNQHFLTGVATGRRMKIERVRQLADGRVWIAAEAKTLGLIDEVASFDAAMTAITNEVSKMNADTFRQYAAEHPDSAEVKDLIAKGYKTGVAEATAEARKELKAMLDACPARQQLAVESFLAGRDIDTTKAMASAADAAAEAKDVEIAKLKAQLAKAEFNAGSQGAVGTGGAASAAAANANSGGNGAGKPELADDGRGNPTLESAKAVAGWEWDNNQQTPAGMASKEKYVNLRCRVLTGQIRISSPA